MPHFYTNMWISGKQWCKLRTVSAGDAHKKDETIVN